MQIKLTHGTSNYRADVARYHGEWQVRDCARYQRPYVLKRPFGCVNLSTGEPHGQMTVGSQWIRVRKPGRALSALFIRAAFAAECGVV